MTDFYRSILTFALNVFVLPLGLIFLVLPSDSAAQQNRTVHLITIADMHGSNRIGSEVGKPVYQGRETKGEETHIHLLSAMLLYGRGIMDIGSSDPDKNEIAWGEPQGGVFFTHYFLNQLVQVVENTQRFNRSDAEKILQETQDGLNEAIKELDESGASSQFLAADSQTPTIKVFQLDLQ